MEHWVRKGRVGVEVGKVREGLGSDGDSGANGCGGGGGCDGCVCLCACTHNVCGVGGWGGKRGGGASLAT